MKDKDKIVAELRRKAEAIIASFDFGKVAEDFRAMGYYYVKHGKAPGARELADTAKFLLDTAITGYAESPADCFCKTETGRLMAYIADFGYTVEISLCYAPQGESRYIDKDSQQED